MANKSAAQVVDKIVNSEVALLHSGDFTGGSVRHALGYISAQEPAAADNTPTPPLPAIPGDVNGDVFRFVRIPAKARLLSVKITSGTVSMNASGAHIGFYNTTLNGGKVINVSAIEIAHRISTNDRQREVLDLSAEDKVKDVAALLNRTTMQRSSELAYDIALTLQDSIQVAGSVRGGEGGLVLEVYYIL